MGGRGRGRGGRGTGGRGSSSASRGGASQPRKPKAKGPPPNAAKAHVKDETENEEIQQSTSPHVAPASEPARESVPVEEAAPAAKEQRGGLHKFDADEVDVEGGKATADDFMDAFGFGGDDAAPAEEAAAEAPAAGAKEQRGGLHKFDADEVDVEGGKATADDFMDAFGFGGDDGAAPAEEAAPTAKWVPPARSALNVAAAWLLELDGHTTHGVAMRWLARLQGEEARAPARGVAEATHGAGAPKATGEACGCAATAAAAQGAAASKPVESAPPPLPPTPTQPTPTPPQRPPQAEAAAQCQGPADHAYAATRSAVAPQTPAARFAADAASDGFNGAKLALGALATAVAVGVAVIALRARRRQ